MLDILIPVLVGVLVGLFGLDGWHLLSARTELKCRQAGIRESMTAVAQFLVFNVYIFSVLGLISLLFSTFEGDDFELRKFTGRVLLIAWSVALLVRVFVIQDWLLRKFDKERKTKDGA